MFVCVRIGLLEAGSRQRSGGLTSASDCSTKLKLLAVVSIFSCFIFFLSYQQLASLAINVAVKIIIIIIKESSKGCQIMQSMMVIWRNGATAKPIDLVDLIMASHYHVVKSGNSVVFS